MQNLELPCTVYSPLYDLKPPSKPQANVVLELGQDYCVIHRADEKAGHVDIFFVQLSLKEHSLDAVDSELADMEDKQEILESDFVIVFTLVRQEGPTVLIGKSIPGRETLRIDTVFEVSSK
jgi:hypothetical protein